jgi:hypothetical protein
MLFGSMVYVSFQTSGNAEDRFRHCRCRGGGVSLQASPKDALSSGTVWPVARFDRGGATVW